MSEIERITFDSAVCAGRPCLRGLRIRVKDVLELLAAGLPFTLDRFVRDRPGLDGGLLEGVDAPARICVRDHPAGLVGVDRVLLPEDLDVQAIAHVGGDRDPETRLGQRSTAPDFTLAMNPLPIENA